MPYEDSRRDDKLKNWTYDNVKEAPHQPDAAFRAYQYRTQMDWAISPSMTNDTTRLPGICIRSSSPVKVPGIEDEALINKFEQVLKSGDLNQLKKLSWNGIPQKLRGVCWRLLLGYTSSESYAEQLLEAKRAEYWSLVDRYFDDKNKTRLSEQLRQIEMDVPRTNSKLVLFQIETIKRLLERVLFIWAVRHPASGYVQGMNDLVTPFLVVFLSEHIDIDEVLTASSQPGARRQSLIDDLSSMKVLPQIEADTFWCTWHMLDSLQDNYTFAQPAIQSSVHSMELLVKRIDAPLYHHLITNGIHFLQFAFRWMNNLLMRELPLRCIIRLFDTYHAEGKSNYVRLHIYVCVAFLQSFNTYIKQQSDFQAIMISLQNLPTSTWTTSNINVLLAEAYRLRCLFEDCPKHLGETRFDSFQYKD